MTLLVSLTIYLIVCFLDIMSLLEGVQRLEKRLTSILIDSGLSLSQFRILLHLSRNSIIIASDLSVRLNITRASISALINELQRANLITTVRNKKDRRSSFIQLSENGRKRLNDAMENIQVMAKQISKQLPKEMIRTLNCFGKYFENNKKVEEKI